MRKVENVFYKEGLVGYCKEMVCYFKGYGSEDNFFTVIFYGGRSIVLRCLIYIEFIRNDIVKLDKFF